MKKKDLFDETLVARVFLIIVVDKKYLIFVFQITEKILLFFEKSNKLTKKNGCG